MIMKSGYWELEKQFYITIYDLIDDDSISEKNDEIDWLDYWICESSVPFA